MRVNRLDVGLMGTAEMTPEGFLCVPASLTRAGVFHYMNPDGSMRRELRLPGDVFDAGSMATLKMKPVTNEHPLEKVTADNVKQYQVGTVGENIAQRENFLDCKLMLTDRQVIEDVMSGKKRELSCGYSATLEPTAGVYEGEPFDVIQRNISYNHVAVVERGRAGPDVRMRLDAAQAIDGKDVMKLKLGNVELEVSEAAGIEIQKRLDSQAAEIVSLRADKEKAEGRADTAEAAVKKAQEDLKAHQDAKPSDADLRARFKARLALEARAEKAKIEKLDSLSDTEIKRALILAHDKDAKLDGKSDDYISGRFESLPVEAEATPRADVLAAAVAGAKDTKLDSAEDARKRAMTEAQDAWKKPLGKGKV